MSHGTLRDAEPHGAIRDVIGVLDAVDVPLLVIGRDGRLTHFNQAAGETFRLTPSDANRRVCEMGMLADAVGLDALCAQVMADGEPCRRELTSGDRRFVLRLAPYGAAGGDIQGAVLTFTNVTAFRASIDQAIYEREYTKAILNTVIDPLVVLDSDLRVQTANRAFYSMFGTSRDETQGHPLRDLGDSAWNTAPFWGLLEASAAGDGEFEACELEREFPGIGRRSLVVEARRLSRRREAAILLTLHDVTDRKLAEEELRRSREELLDFVENASIGMHWVGPDGLVQWVNRTELELLGYSREEFVGRHIAEFHADKGVSEDILGRLKGGGIVHDRAARLRCKDGSTRDVLINSNALWDGDTFVHSRCFTRDITEKKRAELALGESERRFREMIDALPVAVYTTDAEGTISHFNPACVELSGRVPEIGKDRWCVTWKLRRTDGTRVSHDECPMARAISKGAIIRGEEAIAERPDGTRVWLMPYPTPLRDAQGHVVGGINVLVDITQSKQAEQALRESEVRFRTLFESMDEGYCVVEVLFDDANHSFDYRFLETNPVFEKQTGIKDARGRLMRQVAPAHELHWFDVCGRVALTGETVRCENVAAALGRYYDVCAFRVGAPELRRVGIVFNDITARRNAEEVVRQSQQALIEADKRKDEFLATLAHELRNPLAPIRNALHILRTGNKSNLDVARVQDMMERQVGHMVRLVDDLLELSRISRGQIELQKRPVELASVIAHAVEASTPLIESRAHELEVRLPSEPLVVDGDPVRLSQIFANLLNNAAKYTEHRGSITLTARREQDTHIVSVRDTGVGLPADMLSRIFDMFTQVKRARGRSHEGLGIGLSLVRSLVAMHGGSVEARSAGLGQGSEFVVLLPACESPARTDSTIGRGANKGPVAPALRILVVDDNEDAADTMAELLSTRGADVKVAYDGDAALAILRSHRPSVMVLDIGMPGLDGHEVARRVRSDPDFRDVTLIALTGWGQEENRRRTKEAGFDHHLVKPVQFETLEALLSSVPAKELPSVERS